MKPIVLVTGAIAIFGVGFVAGHYQGTDSEAKIDITNTARQGERSPLTVNTMPNKAGFPVSRTSQTDGSDLQPIQVQQHGKSQAAPSPPVLPPHERVFSIEERAQWEAQQREAKKTRLAEVDAMIHSMESAGFPEEQVKNFREQKEELAKAPIDEFPVGDLSPLESTPEEMKADFAASLEQANVPEAHRKAMLEAFSPRFQPNAGNPPNFSPPALPPHEPPN